MTNGNAAKSLCPKKSHVEQTAEKAEVRSDRRLQRQSQVSTPAKACKATRDQNQNTYRPNQSNIKFACSHKITRSAFQQHSLFVNFPRTTRPKATANRIPKKCFYRHRATTIATKKSPAQQMAPRQDAGILIAMACGVVDRR
jgi:hypothetical protein